MTLCECSLMYSISIFPHRGRRKAAPANGRTPKNEHEGAPPNAAAERNEGRPTEGCRGGGVDGLSYGQAKRGPGQHRTAREGAECCGGGAAAARQSDRALEGGAEAALEGAARDAAEGPDEAAGRGQSGGKAARSGSAVEAICSSDGEAERAAGTSGGAGHPAEAEPENSTQDKGVILSWVTEKTSKRDRFRSPLRRLALKFRTLCNIVQWAA